MEVLVMLFHQFALRGRMRYAPKIHTLKNLLVINFGSGTGR